MARILIAAILVLFTVASAQAGKGGTHGGGGGGGGGGSHGGGGKKGGGPATVAQLNASDPMTWLVKSVCVDSSNQVLAVDPYAGCPTGAGIRKIEPGDPLPYHNLDQEGVQQRDAYPLDNPVDGSTWIIATFDYVPFDSYNLFGGTDGYDVYTERNGWEMIADTSDGGGYGQTFYGSNCTIGTGWGLFPASNFLNGGSTKIAIADLYWEKTGQSYPGACPSGYSSNTQTSWVYQPGFSFGGAFSNPTKVMDTLISYHGFQNSKSFPTNGHLEVFYFTREYGITRWETWTPIAQNPVKTTRCVVPDTQTYQGVSFVVTDCRDWSTVTAATTPEIPTWPIPNINLLADAHFADPLGAMPEGWASLSSAVTGSVAASTAARDTFSSSQSVHYLQAECTAGCGGLDHAIYQDIPLVASIGSGTYAFGVNVRTEPDSTGDTSGQIAVAIEQLDAAGNVLSTDTTSATVTTDNVTGTGASGGEHASVYLSTAFVHKTVSLSLDPQAVSLRFLIAPQTPGIVYDVLDGWFAAWPLPSAGFGQL